jgi:hypothetical protein
MDRQWFVEPCIEGSIPSRSTIFLPGYTRVWLHPTDLESVNVGSNPTTLTNFDEERELKTKDFIRGLVLLSPYLTMYALAADNDEIRVYMEEDIYEELPEYVVKELEDLGFSYEPTSWKTYI